MSGYYQNLFNSSGTLEQAELSAQSLAHTVIVRVELPTSFSLPLCRVHRRVCTTKQFEIGQLRLGNGNANTDRYLDGHAACGDCRPKPRHDPARERNEVGAVDY